MHTTRIPVPGTDDGSIIIFFHDGDPTDVRIVDPAIPAEITLDFSVLRSFVYQIENSMLTELIEENPDAPVAELYRIHLERLLADLKAAHRG